LSSVDEQQRWRVILEGTCAEELALVEPAELVSHAGLRLLGEQTPGGSPSYEWHPGPEITGAISVTAPDAETAEALGAELLLPVIPHPPLTTVTSLKAHLLKAEPDFI
jgi:hypothetical protein